MKKLKSKILNFLGLAAIKDHWKLLYDIELAKKETLESRIKIIEIEREFYLQKEKLDSIEALNRHLIFRLKRIAETETTGKDPVFMAKQTLEGLSE